MPSPSAEYMREYRRRKKAEAGAITRPDLDPNATRRANLANTSAAFWECTEENQRLTEEVARLKRDLAARAPTPSVKMLGGSFGVSRPAPKPHR